MSLALTGELLAVATRQVSAKPGEWDAYETTTVTVFDQRVYEVRLGRDFPLAAMAQLRKASNEGIRAHVVLGVFPGSGGRLYADSLLEMVVPDAA